MNRMETYPNLLPGLAIWIVLALVYMTGVTVALMVDNMAGTLFFTTLTMGSLVAIASIPPKQEKRGQSSNRARRRSRRQSI